jgi:hypothetical protein
MVKVVFRKEQVAGVHVLVPADRTAEEWLGKTKLRQSVLLKAERPHNIKFHSKFFAFLHVVHENQDRVSDFDLWREELLIEMGYYYVTISRAGEIRLHARSLSFATMTEQEFSRVYDSFVEHVCHIVIPGLDSMDLEREVMAFLA